MPVTLLKELMPQGSKEAFLEDPNLLALEDQQTHTKLLLNALLRSFEITMAWRSVLLIR